MGSRLNRLVRCEWLKRMTEDWNSIAKQVGFETESEMWHSLYTDHHRSVLQLSQDFNCGSATITRRLKLNGVKMRPKGGPNNDLGQTRKLLMIDPRILWRRNESEVAGML